MDSYTSFAKVYDTFMDNVPYTEWAEYIANQLEKYDIPKTALNPAGSEAVETCVKLSEKNAVLDEALLEEKGSVLDLGCGTGTLTSLLYQKGYSMMGVDNSEEMLEIAQEKKTKSGEDILYLCQDMRDLELYGTVGALISVCDSLNYILEEDELQEVFSLVNNYLFPGGVFLFDFNTTYKYAEIIGDTTIAENRDECSFIWDNYYHEEEGINEYDLTIFVKEEDERFSRFQETHYQRGYTLDEMKGMLEKAGLEFIEAVDSDTKKAPTEESERIFVVARECTKALPEGTV